MLEIWHCLDWVKGFILFSFMKIMSVKTASNGEIIFWYNDFVDLLDNFLL